MNVSEACEIVMSGRRYPVTHWLGEIVEVLEALLKRDSKEARMEFQQVLWGIQILIHQRTGLDFKIRFCDDVILEEIARRKTWKKIFNKFDIEFKNDYLTSGSNFRRFRKIQDALKKAGVTVSDKQAIQLVELFYNEN